MIEQIITHRNMQFEVLWFVVNGTASTAANRPSFRRTDRVCDDFGTAGIFKPVVFYIKKKLRKIFSFFFFSSTLSKDGLKHGGFASIQGCACEQAERVLGL